jgi:DNA-binding NtrC family response regulator
MTLGGYHMLRQREAIRETAMRNELRVHAATLKIALEDAYRSGRTGDVQRLINRLSEDPKVCFREDLYWRLNVILINVPPLRDQAFDIPLLIEHFMAKACQSSVSRARGFAGSPRVLRAYPWPGSVRELENAIERAVAFTHGARVTPEDLPKRVRAGGMSAIIARSSEQNLSLRELERAYICEMLRRTGGNKKRAAKRLSWIVRHFIGNWKSTTRTAIGWNCSFLPHYEA